jgi:hypothetical protein
MWSRVPTEEKKKKMNNNNSILVYLRADSTTEGHLQSQHGHMQQKQWTTQGQYTETSGLQQASVHTNLE